MSEEFNLSREIERYTARITSGIRSPRTRARVQEEYRGHIEDYVDGAVLRGMTPEEALNKVRDELGDERKIEEILAGLHNRYRLSSRMRILLWVAGILFALSTYWIFPNEIYRSWFVLFLQLILLVLGCVLLYTVWRYADSLRIRRAGYRRLLRYAKEQGYQLSKKRNIYRSIFSLGKQPELVLDTPKTRFLLYLFPTVRKRKTLRLLDSGLYSYWDNIGYMYLYTRHTALFGPSWYAFVPRGVRPFATFHSEMRELPRGMHLLPEVDWSPVAMDGRGTVCVYLLSPIPFKLVGVERGVAREMGDDATFCGKRVWSFSGFVSYLEGLRISGKTHIDG